MLKECHSKCVVYLHFSRVENETRQKCVTEQLFNHVFLIIVQETKLNF
jgi:hypothetical protein